MKKDEPEEALSIEDRMVRVMTFNPYEPIRNWRETSITLPIEQPGRTQWVSRSDQMLLIRGWHFLLADHSPGGRPGDLASLFVQDRIIRQTPLQMLEIRGSLDIALRMLGARMGQIEHKIDLLTSAVHHAIRRLEGDDSEGSLAEPEPPYDPIYPGEFDTTVLVRSQELVEVKTDGVPRNVEMSVVLRGLLGVPRIS